MKRAFRLVEYEILLPQNGSIINKTMLCYHVLYRKKWVVSKRMFMQLALADESNIWDSRGLHLISISIYLYTYIIYMYVSIVYIYIYIRVHTPLFHVLSYIKIKHVKKSVQSIADHWYHWGPVYRPIKTCDHSASSMTKIDYLSLFIHHYIYISLYIIISYPITFYYILHCCWLNDPFFG